MREWLLRVRFDEQSACLVCAFMYNLSRTPAARLIMGVVTDNPKARYSAKLHKGLANAIAKIASNQSSLDGKFYWLNSVMQLLHVLSSTPEYGVRSPMEVGIDLESRKLTSSQAGPLVPPASSALGDFPNRVHELSLSIYQMILDDVRDLVVNEALVRAIFDPALTSRASLGAKHNAGNARSPDSIAAGMTSTRLRTNITDSLSVSSPVPLCVLRRARLGLAVMRQGSLVPGGREAALRAALLRHECCTV